MALREKLGVVGVVSGFGAIGLFIAGIVSLLTPEASWSATTVYLGGGVIAGYLAHRFTPPALSTEEEEWL